MLAPLAIQCLARLVVQVALLVLEVLPRAAPEAVVDHLVQDSLVIPVPVLLVETRVRLVVLVVQVVMGLAPAMVLMVTQAVPVILVPVAMLLQPVLAIQELLVQVALMVTQGTRVIKGQKHPL